MRMDPTRCEHANEVPTGPCPCDRECYCKGHTCKGRVSVAAVPVVQYQLPDEEVWFRAFIAAIDAGHSNGSDAAKWGDRALIEFKKRFR